MGTAYFFSLTAFLMISSCFTGNYIMEQGRGDSTDGLEIPLPPVGKQRRMISV